LFIAAHKNTQFKSQHIQNSTKTTKNYTAFLLQICPTAFCTYFVRIKTIASTSMQQTDCFKYNKVRNGADNNHRVTHQTPRELFFEVGSDSALGRSSFERTSVNQTGLPKHSWIPRLFIAEEP